jgi:hypothetical protein
MIKKYWMMAKTIILAVILVAAVVLFFLWKSERTQRIRLDSNQTALLDEMRTDSITGAATVGQLTLRMHEFKNATDSQTVALRGRITDLGIKLKRVQSAGTASFYTTITVDTVLIPAGSSTGWDGFGMTPADSTAKRLVIHNRFHDVDLLIRANDSVTGVIITRDTMDQIVTRTPRGWPWQQRFWQPRRMEQTVHFQNPDTRITYERYIVISKKKP